MANIGQPVKEWEIVPTEEPVAPLEAPEIVEEPEYAPVEAVDTNPGGLERGPA